MAHLGEYEAHTHRRKKTLQFYSEAHTEQKYAIWWLYFYGQKSKTTIKKTVCLFYKNQ